MSAALSDADRKRFDTARAVGALNGLVVRMFENDAGRAEFLVTRDALTAFAPSLDELENRLRRFGISA